MLRFATEGNMGIDTLHPAIRDHVRAALNELQQAGYDVRVMATYRSKSEQDQLYEKGDNGRRVTTKAGGDSYHNYGLAFDLVPVAYLGDTNWNPNGEQWQEIADIVKRHGFLWGGDPGVTGISDRPHFHDGRYSTEELKSMPTFEENGYTYPLLPQQFSSLTTEATPAPAKQESSRAQKIGR